MMHAARLAALLIAAGASAAGALPRPPETAGHDYVLGRFAYVDDQLPRAARYFDAARKLAPGDLALSRRTFDLAVAAGDEKLAVALANQLAGTNRGDSTVALVRVAEALQRRDWKAADAARPGLADAGYAAVVGPVVAGWTMFGRGRTDEALALLDPAKFQGFARSYVSEHRALMLGAAKRYDAAATEYAALMASGAANVARVRIAAATALQGAGKAKPAAALFEGITGDPQIDTARARLAAGKPIGGGVGEPRQGVAWLAVRLAADLAREKPVPLALVFARVATFLAPELAETWLITGDVLARGNRADAAIAAYARVPATDALAPVARARRALVLADAGRDKDARAMLEAAAAAPAATSDDWARLGDFDRKAMRPADAARAYDRAIAVAGSVDAAGWQLYFLRGSAYEQAADWARAEPDLRQALKLSPQEPIVLNYLGYALLDRGLQPARSADTDRSGGEAEARRWLHHRLARLGLLPDRPVRQGRRRARTCGCRRARRSNDQRASRRCLLADRAQARSALSLARGDRPRCTAAAGRGDPGQARLRPRCRPRAGVGVAKGPGRALILTEAAPAKLNLALHVRRRRADGYHDLETIFAFTGFGDTLTAGAAAGLSLTIEGEFGAAVGAGDNLVLRAARALAEAGGVGAGAALHLIKRIPVAAGLGGGSADAAAALRLLNRLWRLDWPLDRLAALGAALGADVPACVPRAGAVRYRARRTAHAVRCTACRHAGAAGQSASRRADRDGVRRAGTAGTVAHSIRPRPWAVYATISSRRHWRLHPSSPRCCARCTKPGARSLGCRDRVRRASHCMKTRIAGTKLVIS